ncbi:MAG: hypothetical protein SFY56_06065 [Bacteroidota bacterium]|nr:hypothetical protein [Bacteroidota bacterium]
MENTVNFLELSANAMRADASIEDKNKLFKHFFELEEWIFILPKAQQLPDSNFFISEVDNKLWIFIFTDSDKALTFGKANPERLINDEGGINYLSIKTKEALRILNSLEKSNVYGLQINYGLPGWFVPISSLENIIKFLNIEIK